MESLRSLPGKAISAVQADFQWSAGVVAKVASLAAGFFEGRLSRLGAHLSHSSQQRASKDEGATPAYAKIEPKDVTLTGLAAHLEKASSTAFSSSKAFGSLKVWLGERSDHHMQAYTNKAGTEVKPGQTLPPVQESLASPVLSKGETVHGLNPNQQAVLKDAVKEGDRGLLQLIAKRHPEIDTKALVSGGKEAFINEYAPHAADLPLNQLLKEMSAYYTGKF